MLALPQILLHNGSEARVREEIDEMRMDVFDTAEELDYIEEQGPYWQVGGLLQDVVNRLERAASIQVLAEATVVE